MFTESDIRREMDRLDSLSGLDTTKIPIRISTRMTRTFGKCCYLRRGRVYTVQELVFADRLLQGATEEHILNVVRHEYAHAYVVLKHQRDDGHGKLWREAALAFGCNGQRCDSFPELLPKEPPAKYTIRCTTCGAVFQRQRRSKLVKWLEEKPDRRDLRCACGGTAFQLTVHDGTDV